MFGPDMLVAPVMYEGARERRVYLPAGTSWENAWTGEKYGGGRTVEVKSDLGTIPVFIREGSGAAGFFRRKQA